MKKVYHRVTPEQRIVVPEDQSNDMQRVTREQNTETTNDPLTHVLTEMPDNGVKWVSVDEVRESLIHRFIQCSTVLRTEPQVAGFLAGDLDEGEIAHLAMLNDAGINNWVNNKADLERRVPQKLWSWSTEQLKEDIDTAVEAIRQAVLAVEKIGDHDFAKKAFTALGVIYSELTTARYNLEKGGE